LVRTFNDFYANCRILGQPEKIAHKRLILAKTFNTVLADAANIIGIKLMEEM
jgi:arginyl-tRNA synthetase